VTGCSIIGGSERVTLLVVVNGKKKVGRCVRHKSGHVHTACIPSYTRAIQICPYVMYPGLYVVRIPPKRSKSSFPHANAKK
jgi:hypothetical protein